MEVLIVADDMTGSNVTNSLLAKQGLKVGTLTKMSITPGYENYDALGVNTESRGVSREEAYHRVKKCVDQSKSPEIKFYNKRIDSTMRGNIGGEIQGMLDSLGEEYIAFVVPAYPDSEKIVIGNYMLVDGKLLELTDVAVDPTSPVHSSRINTIINEQTRYSIGTISMETIALGKDAILDTIDALISADVRIIVLDATSNEQIQEIAEAVVDAQVPFISVDPGPFTQALVNITKNHQELKGRQKILYLIGSASPIAVDQIAHLRIEHDPIVVKINAEKFIEKSTFQDEVDRVFNQVMDNIDKGQMFLVATMINQDDKLNLQELSKKHGQTLMEISARICEGIADTGKKILEESDNQFGAIYTSGGDVTVEFLSEVGAEGVQIIDEIEPLTVYGQIMGGVLDDLSIVTKGGLAGGQKTLSHVASYLKTQLSSQYIDQ